MRDFKKKQDVKGTDDTLEKLKAINVQLIAYLGAENRNLGHIEVLGYLGEGTYALVNLAVDHIRRSHVALKIFEKKTLLVRRRMTNLIVSLLE